MPTKRIKTAKKPTLNPRQLQFLRLYTGRDLHYHGKGAECYRAVYNPNANPKVAWAGANRLLNHPAVNAALVRAEKKALEAAQIDSKFVLEQSVILFDRAMGYEAVEEEFTDSKGNVRTRSRRTYNASIAAKALELIGKHADVQAFQDNVNHTHTHQLEERLLARTKAIEGRARLVSCEDSQALPDLTNEDLPQADAERVPYKEVSGAPSDPDDDESAILTAGAPGK